MARDYQLASHLARFYRRHLMEDIIGFWNSRTLDKEFGGYLVPHERTGRSVGTDKNTWCQARHVHMFSELYQKVDRNERWLELARSGRDFLLRHAYAGKGVWRYLLDRRGRPLDESRSLFADMIALMALCAYSSATVDRTDLPVIEETYQRVERAVQTPDFNEYHHFSLDPAYMWMTPRMMVVGMAPTTRAILGDRVDPLVKRCLDEIQQVFAVDRYEAMFEALQPDGSIPETALGRTLNPGHALETLWFCMEEGIYREDRSVINRAREICDWMYRRGHDSQYGGLLGFVDLDGGRPAAPEIQNPWGERWDDKIWWVHSESLYTLLLTAVTCDDAVALERFLDLHDYCQRYFVDHEFGEWYEYLYRCGSVRSSAKGSWIKCAFHVPRALIRIVHLLERQVASPSPQQT